MPAITKPATREIIEDFAKEICERRARTAKPSRTVINFRTDIQAGNEREVWLVPIEILRYRKDNGRITSNVEDYERNVRPLDETDAGDQAQLHKFLEDKDPEKTDVLRQTILHDGQREPAIITCDGFLINGNRRKMVMECLHQEFPGEDKFSYMKVVILPGPKEEGGLPTLKEIEQIENRYQLQSDGKAEYYGFDRALSIRRKIKLGLSLKEQLLDDPQFAKVSDADIRKAEKRYTQDYLEPLACVDRYLAQFGRAGQYRTISTGLSDPEGRWQAFLDYSNTYSRWLKNPKKLIELGIEEEEVGAIEEAAFNIIRLRTVPDMPKVHMIMRKFPKYCRTSEGKKAIFKISQDVEAILPGDECPDESSDPLTAEEVDAKWAAKNKQPIIQHLKKAELYHNTAREKETPLELLEAAYKKLKHQNMDLTAIAAPDLPKARRLAAKIKGRAQELETEIYHYQKKCKKIARKCD